MQQLGGVAASLRSLGETCDSLPGLQAGQLEALPTELHSSHLVIYIESGFHGVQACLGLELRFTRR